MLYGSQVMPSMRKSKVQVEIRCAGVERPINDKGSLLYSRLCRKAKLYHALAQLTQTPEELPSAVKTVRKSAD